MRLRAYLTNGGRARHPNHRRPVRTKGRLHRLHRIPAAARLQKAACPQGADLPPLQRQAPPGRDAGGEQHHGRLQDYAAALRRDWLTDPEARAECDASAGKLK